MSQISKKEIDNKTTARRKVLSDLKVFYIAKVQGAWGSLDQDFHLKKERKEKRFPGLKKSRSALNWTISKYIFHCKTRANGMKRGRVIHSVTNWYSVEKSKCNVTVEKFELLFISLTKENNQAAKQSLIL